MPTESVTPAKFDRPVFLLSSPRSGSTLLFETLLNAPKAYSIGGESHALIETVPGLHPAARGWHSNRLTAADLTPTIAHELIQRFHSNLRNRDRRAAPTAMSVRMIEKTPKNSLRIPFLSALFPDAMFVFLYRDWRQTLASMIEAWSSGRFVTYPRLPDWPKPSWSLLLTPDWQSLRGKPLAQIVARQWAQAIDTLIEDLESLPSSKVSALGYRDLVNSPRSAIPALCNAICLDWDLDLGTTLPLSKTTVSHPATEKWRRYEEQILSVEYLVTETDARARAFLARHGVY